MNFFVNFDLNNGCKNEFEDNNEKSCSRFKNKVPRKIDFRADRTHESIPTAWELTYQIDALKLTQRTTICWKIESR